MSDVGLFSNLSFLNKIALFSLFIAKLFGLIGISFGFIGGKYLHTGGYVLGLAIISIFFSVFCGLVQTTKDKQRFQNEDETRDHLKKLNETKAKLEKEIRDLEEQKSAVHKFLTSR